jgi:phosphoribosyl-dephospho-CoA transferase
MLGLKPKHKELTTSTASTSNDVTENPAWLCEMQKELLAVKVEVTHPIKDNALNKLVDNFFKKILPVEYKKYLQNPAANLGGKWIIVTHYSFNNNPRILLLALPIIAKKLKPLNIRVEDRGNNGFIWINADDITKSLESVEQSDRKWLQLYSNHPS